MEGRGWRGCADSRGRAEPEGEAGRRVPDAKSEPGWRGKPFPLQLVPEQVNGPEVGPEAEAHTLHPEGLQGQRLGRGRGWVGGGAAGVVRRVTQGCTVTVKVLGFVLSLKPLCWTEG